MRFVIITGMSGAGKSSVLKILEDNNYFCVDNLPIELMMNFAEFTYSDKSSSKKNVAVVLDVRNGESLKEIDIILAEMKTKGYDYEILFLDAEDDMIIKRFKETRRAHPLSTEGRVDEGIIKERKALEYMRKEANYIFDTSNLLIKELKKKIEEVFVENKKFSNLFITVLSFGFKYGIPTDADLVFDVRFMPNPYYIEELKHKTGNDKEVREYVMDSEISRQFMDKFMDMIEFLIPNYVNEGKNQLVIAVGCTGGKHRSVTVANELYNRFSKDKDLGINVAHRDITRN